MPFWSERVLLAQPVPAATQTPARVRLIFDEQSMGDSTRAQVYDLIARSVPESNWPTLQVSRVTDIRALLNTYFDLYSNGNGAAPRTQEMVGRLIAAANVNRLTNASSPTVTAGPVKVPPIPIRAYTFYEKSEITARRFDPATMSYELRSATGGVERVSEAIAPVKPDQAERRGRLTEVLVTMNDAVRSQLQTYGAAFRRVVAVDDDAEGATTLRLLSDQPALVCNSAGTWLSASPYLSSMRNALTSDERSRITAAAVNVPLAIVDWNIDTPNGHGAKVRAVVKEVLNALGLSALEPRIVTIELNPARNREGLKALLVAYKDHLTGPGASDIAGAFGPAEKWVKDHVPADPDSLSQRVPSLLLQAIFWNLFQKSQALNFSFTTDSAALTAIDANFMVGAKAFGTFAAGNSGMPLSPVLRPQGEAYRWSNVVNVTHGRADGVIDGDISNIQFKVLVNLVAPGCGYTTAPLVAADNGSSFASPYVATVAWIRMLQGVPAKALKRALITASQPLVSVGQRVESGGLFDPALLLLHPGSHMVTPQGAFLALSSLKFTMTYVSDGVGITIQSTPAPEPIHAVTFQPCPGSSDLCTIVRRWQPDGSLWMTSGIVQTFTFEAVSGQQTLVPADAGALLKLVRLVTF
jgi:hypothetical protein